MDSERLEGRVAVVTGASRGIGRAIALRLAAEGATVAVHYGNKREAAAETVSMIEAKGGAAFAVGSELDSLEGVHRLLRALDEELIRRHGSNRFDILVNNAGIGTSPSFDETKEDDFDRLISVNVKAPFFLVQQSLERLRDGGRIINISSGVTRIAYPHIMAYNLTKGALNTFTLHLAKLLGPRGITVNAVMPGIIDTEVNAAWLHTPDGHRSAVEMSALGRVGEPSDVADIVAFAASPDARWITGQMIDATGGSHL